MGFLFNTYIYIPHIYIPVIIIERQPSRSHLLYLIFVTGLELSWLNMSP